MRAIYKKLGPKGNLAAFLLIFAIGLACYIPVLRGGLQNDDFNWFLNALTRGPLGNDHTAPQGGMFWRPVLSVVFWCLYKIFGVDPIPFRVFNVLLAAMAGYSLRAIWLRIAPAGVDRSWSALAVGVLFVIWPTHPETTAWIAGMTDGLAIAFGALGLWAYIAYRESERALLLAASLVLFGFAMLSKEAAAPFPLIAFALVCVLSPWKRSEVRIAAINGGLMLALTLAYIGLRSHFVGGLMGGYGNQTGLLQLLGDIAGSKGAYNFSNAFVPFGSYLAYWNFALVRPFVTLALAAGIAWLLWSRPGARPLAAKAARAIYSLAAIWCAAAIFAIVQYLAGNYRLFYSPLLRWGWVAVLLLLGLGYLLFVRRERARRYFVVNVAFRNGALAIAFCVSSVGIYLAGQTWPYREFIIFPGLWWGVYSLRPPRSNPEKARYLTIALVSLAAAFIALLPALVSSLAVGLDGQQSRWSYGATLFSSVAWIAAICANAKFGFMRKRAVLWTLLVSGVLLAPYVVAWSDSGTVSAETERLIGPMLPARRIYVLAAPATIEGAGLFTIGLEHLPLDLFGDAKTQVTLLYRLDNAISADRLICQTLRPGIFEIACIEARGSRLYPPSFAKYSGADRYCDSKLDGRDCLIRLKDFQPSDQVVIIGPQGVSALPNGAN